MFCVYIQDFRSMHKKLKRFLFRNLEKEETHSLVISRRPQRGKPCQYYLYRLDTDSLLISAILYKSKGKKKDYLLSTSAYNITEEDEHIIGKISENQSFVFTTFPCSEAGIDQMKIFLIGKPLSMSCFVNDYGEVINQLSPITVNSNDVDTNSKVNKFFKTNLYYEGKHVISLNQEYKDEFYLTVSEGISIFNAFCISLANIIGYNC